MSMKINKLLITSLALASFSYQSAMAAGLSSNLYSTSGLSTSYAGSATGLHDSSDSFYNAATLTNLENSEVIFSVSHLDLNIDPDNISGGTTNVSDVGENVTIPAFYLAAPINDRTVFGFSVTTPFGLATSYPHGWAGEDYALDSSIETYNFNPSIAYKVTDKLSLAIGAQAQYYKAALTKMVGGQFTKLHGTDWGYGYNLGLTYQPTEKLKLGLGYRSKIEHKVEGRANAPAIAYTTFNLNTVTPEAVDFGISYDVSDKTTIASDIIWTRWSRLTDLTARNHNTTLADDATDLNWNDTFMYALGVEHQANEKLTLRAGAAYETGATPDSTRESRIPLGDRQWGSLGFAYNIGSGYTIDASYVHVFFDNASVKTTSSAPNANYSAYANVYSLAVKKEF